jgi:hypothetical protein
MCPVCGLEYSRTEDLDVDELVLGILKELDAEDPEGVTRAINLNIDGTWGHVSENPDERVPMMRKKRQRLTLSQAAAVAGLGDGTVYLEDSSSESESGGLVRAAARSPAEIVELLDSDDED